MNKVTIIITIAVIAASAASTYAIPVEAKSVNWPIVAAKVAEMRDVVLENTFERIKAIANGQTRIGTKIDAASVSINALLGQINAAVDNQHLTIGQARAVVGEIKATLGRLTGNVQVDLVALNPRTAGQIRQILSDSFDAVEVKAQELVTLLRG